MKKLPGSIPYQKKDGTMGEILSYQELAKRLRKQKAERLQQQKEKAQQVLNQ